MNKDARQLKRGDIEKWRFWLKDVKKLSNTTINKYTSYLNLCYKLAIRDDLLDDTPFKFIKKLEEPKENIKYLTKEEMQQTIKALENFPRFKDFVLIAILTAFRIDNVNHIPQTPSFSCMKTIRIQIPNIQRVQKGCKII